jgi:type I restriction enzyme M protein
MPNTHAKCCVVICQKYKANESAEKCPPYGIFMSDVKWCGHDSRGNPTYTYLTNGEKKLLDDIPLS